MSQLALELINKEKEERTGYLNLGNCSLTELPPELFDCYWLETLIISNDYWDIQKRKWVESPNKGRANNLKILPNEITRLEKLKQLYVGGDDYSINSWSTDNLAVISKLTGLQILNLSKNKISDGGFLSGLTQLHNLYLGGNKISDGKFLSGLTQLQSLYLGSNRISDCGFLSGLTQLQSLHLGSNQISDCGFLSGLTQLQSLHLGSNQISDCGFLSGLTQLQSLHLGSNQISDCGFLSGLTQLQSLFLSSNQISDCGFLSGLTQLQLLELSNNQISDIEPLLPILLEGKMEINLVEYDWAGKINLYGNPLGNPPKEIVAQGREAALEYFKKQEAEREVNLAPCKNYNLKMLIVGNSGAGKSTLLHWLKNRKIKKDIKSTHWLETGYWKVKIKGQEVSIKYFDFGGQEYYHDTHHLFFTNDTAYLLLWDKETNKTGEAKSPKDDKGPALQNYPVRYWLNAIDFYTKKRDAFSTPGETGQLQQEKQRRDSSENERPEPEDNTVNSKESKPTVLVIQNKADTAADIQYLDFDLLKKDYPFIYDFCSVAVTPDRRLGILNTLIEEMLGTMNFVGSEFSATYGMIKEEVEKNEEEKEMNLDSFTSYCNQVIRIHPELKGKNVTKLLFNKKTVVYLATYLHHIGALMYFPENDTLDNIVYVNQKKVLDDIYTVLKELDKTDGECNREHIAAKLGKKEFDQGCANIVALMKQFKIIFEHPAKQDGYIAPLYLPCDPVSGVQLFLDIFRLPIYRYEYHAFIHKSVILNFFNEYGKDALQEKSLSGKQLFYYWRNGIVLKDSESDELLLVRFFIGTESAYAHIDIFCLDKQRSKTYLNKVVNYLDEINRGWNPVKMVTHNGVDFVPLHLVHEKEAKKEWVFVYPEKEGKLYQLTDFRAYLKEPLPMKKLFISYSGTDKEHLINLEKHLSTFRRDGSIDTWHDRKLVPGEKWDGKIKKELEEADIIIFLVSADFLATDYIWDVEIKKAIERDEDPNDAVAVVPIIVRDCLWERSPLGKFNTSPPKAKVIANALNADTAWKEAVTAIEQLIRK